MQFTTTGWINDCIKVLRQRDDIGFAGPINNNNRILTQAFVSRKHMDIFGFYYPHEFKNWFIDDWISEIYDKFNKKFIIHHIGPFQRFLE